MTVIQHMCKGFLKFVLPTDTVAVDMEVMTLKGIHKFQQDKQSNEKTFIPWSEHNKPPSSFLKRLRDIQGTPSKEFLETLVDRNVDKNFRPKTPCKCPKIARRSDREVIMDAKQRQMDNATEMQARNPIPSDWSNDEEDGKDNHARDPIAKPILQDHQPSTSFGTYPSVTLPRVVTFGRGKISPLASGTLTIGHECSILLDQTTNTKEAAIALIPPSPHRIVHNDSVQIYEDPPAPVRHIHSLDNWTSVRLGNDPNRHTVDEMTNGPKKYNSIIDPTDQQKREINNNQSSDPEIMYSNYSTDHLEDLE